MCVCVLPEANCTALCFSPGGEGKLARNDVRASHASKFHLCESIRLAQGQPKGKGLGLGDFPRATSTAAGTRRLGWEDGHMNAWPGCSQPELQP